MSFKSFLSAFGHGFQKVASVAIPIEQAANPYIALFNPGIASALNLGIGVVAAVEKGAQQGTTGADKSAQAVTLAGPAMIQLLKQEGVTINDAQVKAILDGIVAVLNAIPAPTAPAVVPPTP